jgi:hypothetical protein
MGLKIHVEKRNDQLLILKVERDESVQRKLGAFSAGAIWRQHEGDMFAPYKKAIEGEG